MPAIVSAVRIAAPTWPPITPPIVRMTVFIPVATPVSVGRTEVTTMRRHRCEREHDAEAERDVAQHDLPRVVVPDRERGDAERR